jgi:hypothetical protein
MLFDATVESWGEWTFEDCVMQSCAGTALRLCFDGRSMLDRWSVCLLLLCLFSLLPLSPCRSRAPVFNSVFRATFLLVHFQCLSCSASCLRICE